MRLDPNCFIVNYLSDEADQFFLFALCLVQVNPIDLLIHTREETSAPPLHLLTDYTTLVIFQHHIQLETTSLEGFFYSVEIFLFGECLDFLSVRMLPDFSCCCYCVCVYTAN